MDKKKVVIIGGGTAGLTIASHLQKYFDVIVIEKSKHKKYPIIFKIPLMIGLLFRNRKTKYLSYREFEMPNGRKIPYFESNLLGGSSIINGCVHTLGNKSHWKSILNMGRPSIFDVMFVLFWPRLLLRVGRKNIQYNSIMRSAVHLDQSSLNAHFPVQVRSATN